MSSQIWDAERYAANARFVADLGLPLFDLLAPTVDERVLDLGCGDGALTEHIAARGAHVLGVDASPAMVLAARARGIDAQIADGEHLGFEDQFDAVFSNAALHWMKHDPDGVIAGVWRALRPGGRFVAEMGGAGNVSQIVAALYRAMTRRGLDAKQADPWFFPERTDYANRLVHAGFEISLIESFHRPTRLPGDLVGWLEMFAQSFLAPVPQSQREDVLREVRAELLPICCDSAGVWTINYVRLRFVALRPAEGSVRQSAGS